MRTHPFIRHFSSCQMDRIWSHGDDSICIHPGWELVIGWMAIKERWVQIFNKIEMIDIMSSTLRLRKCGNLAIFICLENIKISENGKIQRSCVLSTNVFEHSNTCICYRIIKHLRFQAIFFLISTIPSS